MNTHVYFSLSLMMFLQFAIWGAWSPVLAARLLGPLKMNGKQTGWIYGTIPLGCILSPLIGGWLTDRFIATEYFLAGAHLFGGIFLLLASRQVTFRSLFVTMCLYALVFAPTIPLVNALMFRHLEAAKCSVSAIMIWQVIAWVLVGWFLAGWRRVKGAGDGRDCLILAGVLSLVLAVFCLFLPHTPPPPQGPGDVLPFIKAIALLKDRNILIFFVAAFLVGGLIVFYFLGTARYLGALGVKDTNLPAVMTLAQVAQVVAMLGLDHVLKQLGYRWTLVCGMGLWVVMYGIYAAMRPRWLVIASQSLHGVAYSFFIIVGFVYTDSVATRDFSGSAQALLTVVLFGIGFFLGTQFTGVVMDKFSADGQFRWRPIFLVPCAMLFVCLLAFMALFR